MAKKMTEEQLLALLGILRWMNGTCDIPVWQIFYDEVIRPQTEVVITGYIPKGH